MVRRLLWMIALFIVPMLGAAQTSYEAQRAPVTLSVGGSISYYDADYQSNQLLGAGAYVDFAPFVFDSLGFEGEGRWLTMNSNNGFNEYTYLAGPRYNFIYGQSRKLHPYAKFLVGMGVMQFPYNLAYGRYFAMAPGGGVEYEVARRWRVRGDYEYQIWPSAPGIPGISSASLKPNGVTVGVSYRIF